MPCTEAYREHIMYTFHGFCKTVIRFAAINAWRDRSRRRQKEISLEYLTEEKFYPLDTKDKYFEATYEESPITVCGQTVILTNGELPAVLLSLPEKTGKSFSFTFSVITHSGKSVTFPGFISIPFLNTREHHLYYSIAQFWLCVWSFTIRA